MPSATQPSETRQKRSFDSAPVAYGRWVIRWRWPILAAVLVASLWASAGAGRLGFASDYRVFFSEDNPQLAAFDAVQNIYTKNDNILMVVAPADGQVFTAENLAVIEELTEEAWQMPFAIRVDSVTNFQYSYAEGDDLIVDDLAASASTLNANELARVQSIALQEPALVNRLISPLADVTGVNVTLQVPGKDPAEVREPVAFARELAQRIEAEHPGIEVHLSGLVMLNNAFFESAMNDMATLIPLMYIVLLTAMALLLRSLSGTFATVLVVGLSSGAAMGLAGWYGMLLTPISALAPTMILTMAIADSVHILVTALQAMRRGTAKHDALVEALRVNLTPVTLTTITTAIGFLSMNASDVPPLNHLGNVTALGVVVAFALSVLFLPALMAVLPVRVAASANPTASRSVAGFDALGRFVVRHQHRFLWGMTAAVVLLVAFIPLNELNDQFVQYFDESVEFRHDTDFITEHLTGVYQVEFSLSAAESGGVSNPAYLQKLDEFEAWFKQQEETMHVSNIAETLRRLNKNMHGDDPSYYRLPESRELAAQYLLLYEMSLPYGLDLNNQLNVDKSATRFVVTLEDLTSQELRDVAARAEAWLRTNAPASMFSHAVSPGVMFAHISDRNIQSMIRGTTLAFLLISTILVFALRSWRLGVLSLIPNMVPAAMAFGLWGLTVGRIGFAVSVVVAMTLGIVVDDTVHFLSKYLRARRERGLAPEGAVRYALSSVGTALAVTSVVLIAGFAVLAQSTFLQNSQMGNLSAVTIAFALIADFLLLPVLLIRLDRSRQAQQAVLDEGSLAASS
ncbi:MAG: MMPL family transporter [Acidobacteriota bacterium]